jgi:hypothetical protein
VTLLVICVSKVEVLEGIVLKILGLGAVVASVVLEDEERIIGKRLAALSFDRISCATSA